VKITTFSAIKGGVGKTTLAYNYGEWLASQGNQILFIDLDHQCNLTQTYEVFDNNQTIAEAFIRKDNVKIQEVKPNIDLIAGDMQLDQVETSLENKSNKDMLLFLWLSDIYEEKNIDKYDYIILDTHPDFSIATRNAIAISHSVLSPIIPSEHGFNAKYNLEARLQQFSDEVIDYLTRESYITAQLYFLGNMVKHNTNSSRNFLVTIEEEDDVIAVVPEKELFNRATLEQFPISVMMSDKKIYNRHKNFFEDIEQTFNKIKTVIDQS